MDRLYTSKGDLSFNLTYDIPFKFMFAKQGKTEGLLARFLNHVLELKGEQKIIDLIYNNIEIPESHARGRRLILDLKVTDQAGHTYNIELQRENSASIIKRALYQYSRITSEQLIKNDNFDKISPVYVILLCKYHTYPDREAIRVFKLAPFNLNKVQSQQTLPYLHSHFDSQNLNSYHYLKHRIHKASSALDSLKIYLIELSKDLQDLSPDQQTCLKYLTTDFLFKLGEPKMNQSKAQKQDQSQSTQQEQRYFVHQDASDEVKRWIKEAQERLEYFAGQPDQREAYEQELMYILDHNTAIKQHQEEGFIEGKAEGLAEGKAEGLVEGKSEGRASLIPTFIQVLRAGGMSDHDIGIKLNLSEEEHQIYLK